MLMSPFALITKEREEALYMAAFKSEFEVKRLKCAGLDVHKKVIVAAIIDTHPETLEASYKVKKFSTMNDDILAMKDWLLENNCKDVCMESTGKYWIPVFNTLEPHMDNTVLTHPKYVRAIKGKKTDKRDAKWIANLFRFDIVKSSFIPPSDIRAMRELSRYRLKLSHMATSEKNRYQNSMAISRIRLDSVLSDPFGKSASAIMGYLLSTETIDDEKVLSMVDGRVKASREDILRSVHGFKILAEQKFKMEHAQPHLDMVNASIAQINSEINKLCAPYEKEVRNITTVPGFTSLSASYLIAEIGTDMSVFESDKHFISWCGACPASNNSADRNKSTRIGKGGKYLKPLLIQCAYAAVKDKKNPYYAVKYKRIAKRRGKKKAIIAIARMMLTSIYHILEDGTAWLPCDYEEIVHPKPPKKVVLNMQNVIQFLGEQGADQEILNLIQQQCAAKTS